MIFVFDAVGTLIRPAESISAVYRRVGIKFGIELPQDEVRKRFRAGRQKHFGNSEDQTSSEEIERLKWQTLVSDIFHEDRSIASGELFETLWNHYADPGNWILFGDVTEPLQRLWSAGHEITIASNFDRRLLRILHELPPLDRIELVFCSSETGYLKPDPRFYQAIALVLKKCFPTGSASPLIIGDDPVKDVAAPRSIGWKAALLDRKVDNLSGLLVKLTGESLP